MGCWRCGVIMPAAGADAAASGRHILGRSGLGCRGRVGVGAGGRRRVDSVALTHSAVTGPVNRRRIDWYIHTYKYAPRHCITDDVEGLYRNLLTCLRLGITTVDLSDVRIGGRALHAWPPLAGWATVMWRRAFGSPFISPPLPIRLPTIACRCTGGTRTGTASPTTSSPRCSGPTYVQKIETLGGGSDGIWDTAVCVFVFVYTLCYKSSIVHWWIHPPTPPPPRLTEQTNAFPHPTQHTTARSPPPAGAGGQVRHPPLGGLPRRPVARCVDKCVGLYMWDGRNGP